VSLSNHEYHEGDEFNRFLNQTYGVTLGNIPTPHPHSHINTFLAMGTRLLDKYLFSSSSCPRNTIYYAS